MPTDLFRRSRKCIAAYTPERERSLTLDEIRQIELRLCFFTPAFPNDLDVMARPVTYLTWRYTLATVLPMTSRCISM